MARNRNRAAQAKAASTVAPAAAAPAPAEPNPETPGTAPIPEPAPAESETADAVDQTLAEVQPPVGLESEGEDIEAEADDQPEARKIVTGTERVFRNGKLCIPGPDVEALPQAPKKTVTLADIDKEIARVEKAIDEANEAENAHALSKLEKQLDQLQEERAKIKKPDPNKPRDVHVTSAHLVRTLKGNMAENRLSRLQELARTDNDVKWLLAEYARLSAPEEN